MAAVAADLKWSFFAQKTYPAGFFDVQSKYLLTTGSRQLSSSANVLLPPNFLCTVPDLAHSSGCTFSQQEMLAPARIFMQRGHTWLIWFEPGVGTSLARCSLQLLI
jgi:hypothetical protein